MNSHRKLQNLCDYLHLLLLPTKNRHPSYFLGFFAIRNSYGNTHSSFCLYPYIILIWDINIVLFYEKFIAIHSFTAKYESDAIFPLPLAILDSFSLFQLCKFNRGKSISFLKDIVISLFSRNTGFMLKWVFGSV